MPLQRQSLDISFAQGLDQKTDPNRVQPGRFLSLVNSVFTKQGLLQKRNGFGYLPQLPVTTSTYLTTFNSDLTAIGTSFYGYSAGIQEWVNRGSFQPIQVATLPLIRSNTNQSAVDTAINSGTVCTVYADFNGSTTSYRFAVADLATGQILIAPTPIAPTTGSVMGGPRVFALGDYFIVVFGTSVDTLQYQAISVFSLNVSPAFDMSLTYTPSSSGWGSFDGIVSGSRLFMGWNGGGGVQARYLTSTLGLSNQVQPSAAETADTISLAVDSSTGDVWFVYYGVSAQQTNAFILTQSLTTVLAPTNVTTGVPIQNVTLTAANSSANIYYEVINNYSYNSNDAGTGPTMAPSHYISVVTLSQTGTVGSTNVVVRSVGLASKAFVVAGQTFMLAAFQSFFQPSYFLINGSGEVVAKLAYSNGGGYVSTGLTSVALLDSIAYFGYQIKDVIESVNKTQNPVSPGGVPVPAAGVYSQTGLNLAKIAFSSSATVSSEIAQSLHLSGGFLWQYDGYTPVEHNFFVWPDSIGATASTGAGSLTAQEYNYQVTYEWADNQGNVHRSAPSVPYATTLTGSQNTITLDIPTLRLTYKIASPVKIVVYRWSTGQENFFQVTSITQPILNDATIDNIVFVDAQADLSIIGNNLIYATGGVVEDISAPATNITTLYKTRLFLVDAEDTNLLWYSKQVIEDTPVEMSDLFTIYIPPIASAGISTGGNTALSVMDDKLILFKSNAIAYMTGEGPDNTGANNDFSDAIYITSSVGCSNQRSIVFMPNGLMFQASNGQGIWLLGRDLSTQYIGAPVETLMQGATVLSAINTPGTTQVRFTLDSGVTLMYDYYYQQWGSFAGIPGISSTVFQNEHTFVDKFGRVFQETPGLYLDGASPVLMNFETGWIALAGLQGFERFYFMFILGQWITPFKLSCSLSYNYNTIPQNQATIITPNNFSPAWGGDAVWGSSSPWGGPNNIFQARLFPTKQKCESFQLSVQEIYDPSFGIQPGAGLTLSGLNLVIGAKKAYRTDPAVQNFG